MCAFKILGIKKLSFCPIPIQLKRRSETILFLVAVLLQINSIASLLAA